MSNIGYYFKQISIYLFFIICQVKLSFLFEINGIRPDLLLIFVILNNMKKEIPVLGVISGFLAGFLLDLMVGDVMGISSLTYAVAGFAGALFGRENEKMTKSIIFVICLSAASFHFLLYYSVTLFQLSLFSVFFYTVLPSITYTSMVQAIFTALFPFKKKRKYL